MAVTATSSNVESYRENGFLVVPGLVSPEDVETLRTDAMALCRGDYPHEKRLWMRGCPMRKPWADTCAFTTLTRSVRSYWSRG